MWTRAQVRGAVTALKLVMDLADLTDAECDTLADLVFPKFVARSGLDPSAFQWVVRSMHRLEDLATRH
jgi:hypothetical protein